MIPITLGDTAVNQVIPEFNNNIINEIDVYVVENIKTARRFLKRAGIKKDISDLTFFELNKRTHITELPTFLKPIEQGQNIGVLSEAGCPGVAVDIRTWTHRLRRLPTRSWNCATR